MPPLNRSRSVRGSSSPADSPVREKEPFCLGPFRQPKSYPVSGTPGRRSRANGENVPPDNTHTAAYVKANTQSQDSGSPAQCKSVTKGRNGGATPLPGSPALLPRPPSSKPSPAVTGRKNDPPCAQTQDALVPTKRKLSWDVSSAGAVETVAISAVAEISGSDSGVKVIVRMRPLNNREEQEEAIQIVQKISVNAVALGDQQFTYDAIAGESASQQEVFEMVGLPMVENCLAGFNSSIFAYGQTGSGKTHTMWGSTNDPGADLPPNEERGVSPRVFEKLFARIQQEEKLYSDRQLRYQCRCSFLEIYNEQITDLLEPTLKNLQIREDTKTGVYVDSLSEEYVCNVDDVTRLLLKGLSNRRTSSTAMNNESSRSHSVFTCVIESRFKNLADGVNCVRSSRMNLVDLAGSERQKQTGAAGERLKEAGNINKSLSQLGNVINILAEVAQTGKQRHIPYRDSRLTFLLQESLGGNAKLAMICAISPASSCRSETLSTLRFAQRAKAIQNKAVVNEETANDVNLLREQIRQLKDELMRMKTNGQQEPGTGSYSTGWNARRSYNLLRLSLSHPMTISAADLESDNDLEMEIDEDDSERDPSSQSSNSETKDGARVGRGKLEAIEEREWMQDDTPMEMESPAEDRGLVMPTNAAGSTVEVELTVPDSSADKDEPNMDLEFESPNFDDIDAPNLVPEMRTPELLRLPELKLPTLHSPPLSVSPRLKGSQKRGLSGSPLAPRAELSVLTHLPENSVCDEIYHSTQERFCDGSSVSQSQQPKNQSLVRSSLRASVSGTRPTERLAACLHRGLQILDNQQKTSMATVRRSTGVRFSVQNPDFSMPKIVDKVDKSVQTSPPVLVTTSTSPLTVPSAFSSKPEEVSSCKLALALTETFLPNEVGTSTQSLFEQVQEFRESNLQLSCSPLPTPEADCDVLICENSPARTQDDHLQMTCTQSLQQFVQEAPQLEPPNNLPVKSHDMSQWQLVTMDAPKSSPASTGQGSLLQLTQAVEALLTGAIRRERVAEEEMGRQAAEIEQLNRLVRQYKHERECNAIITQTREDKIARLESLMDNVIPTDEYLNEEWSALVLEHQLLQEKFDNHPEVTHSNVEQQRLLEELQQYRNFFDLGERDVLLEEITLLRNQLQNLLDHSGTPSSVKHRRLSLTRKSIQATMIPPREVASECSSPSSLAFPVPHDRESEGNLGTTMIVADTKRSEELRWEEEKREWEERERDWMSALEEMREEVQSYRRQAEKRKQEFECEKRCSEELQEALQMAMTGHARLLEQYAELQEKHIGLLARQRKIREGTSDVKKMAKKAGVTSTESRWLEAQASQMAGLRVELEEQRKAAKEEIQGLQAQLRDTADAVQAAGELLVRLREAEESVMIAQDAAVIAEQDASGTRRDLEKFRRRHATEIATLQQRLLESRLQKTAVCPMCVMAERVKFQFTEVDAETAQATLEAEARVMALKQEKEWMAAQRQKAAAEERNYREDGEAFETVLTGELEDQGYDSEGLHLDEFDDLDHLFMAEVDDSPGPK